MTVDRTLLARRNRSMGSASPLFYEKPLHLVKGEGAWVWDAEGRRYLDGYNNVPHVGHCHPRVVDALTQQARTLNIHTRYLDETVVAYAEALTSTFPAPLSTAAFCCSGSEANELALRMARFRTGNQGVIVSTFNYHGNTATLAGLTTALPSPEALAPYARTIPIPDTLAGDDGEASLRALDMAIDSLRQSNHGVAALLVDALFANEGLPLVPQGWLRAAAERVRAAGGLMIADEVQAGFGRTGEAMWGHSVHGIIPDIVTLGKPMGNGHPLAGVISTPDMIESFGRAATYFNTFGGNPVSAAVGLAVLNVIVDEHLLSKAVETGAHVQARLHKMAETHDTVARPRGKGLFFGLDLVDARSGVPDGDGARRVINRMREEGVLISRIGPHDNILKMRPPMCFTRDHADHMLDRLDAILAEQ